MKIINTLVSAVLLGSLSALSLVGAERTLAGQNDSFLNSGGITAQPPTNPKEDRMVHTIEKYEAAGMSAPDQAGPATFSFVQTLSQSYNGIVGESCLDEPRYQDEYGDGCAWYYDTGRCSEASAWRNQQGVSAHEACCFCGGGDRGSDATIQPVASADDCVDVPGFFDRDYDGCEFYERIAGSCGQYGHHLDFLPGLTANVACCVCGGGIRGA